MNKQEFLLALKKRLYGLPKDDLEERLAFYGEMIDDRIEEGRTEKEAVADIGSVDDISAQIIAETPLAKIVKERIKPKRRLKAWEIVLLALGSPIWLSLAIAAVAVVLSLYAVLLSFVVALWAVFVSFAACGIGGAAGFVISVASGNAAFGFVLLGGGFVCAGLCLFTYYACAALTKHILIFTKQIAVFIKKCFIKQENVQ